LGALEEAEAKLKQMESAFGESRRFASLHVVLLAAQGAIDEAVIKLHSLLEGGIDRSLERTLIFVMRRKQVESIQGLSEEAKMQLDAARIDTALKSKDWDQAGQILHEYPFEVLSQESSPLFFLYGCWLLCAEGKEIATAHLSGVLDLPYPPSAT